jgi:bifunctional DNA-binding transcriptional regulator/antitoxin component of YhaV-PrlF toxin-antitoxin module
MTVSRKELLDLLEVNFSFDKLSSVSSDGKNLLIRIPVNIRKKLGLERGDKLRWLLKGEKIGLEVVKNAGKA